MKTRPELYDDLQVDMDLFWELSARRTIGFSGPNPISMSDLESGMRVYGIVEWDQKMIFIDRMHVLDNEFMKFCYPPKKVGTDG
jgi:hypothetical protein